MLVELVTLWETQMVTWMAISLDSLWVILSVILSVDLLVTALVQRLVSTHHM